MRAREPYREPHRHCCRCEAVGYTEDDGWLRVTGRNWPVHVCPACSLKVWKLLNGGDVA
jgi:hypothetical protein